LGNKNDSNVVNTAQTNNPEGNEVNNPESENPTFNRPFVDKNANDIAENLGVDAGSMFIFPSGEKFWRQDGMDAMGRRFKPGEDMLPIFPPSVRRWTPLILDNVAKVEKETGVYVPPEFIAFIMQQESQGNPGLYSDESWINDAGIGLMQVLSNLNISRFDPNATVHDRYKPDNNIYYGVRFLAEQISMIERLISRKLDYSYPPDLAMIGRVYNGGPGAIEWGTNVYPMIYSDNVQRFAITAAMAQRLRKQGYDNEKIVHALRSPEMNVRMSTFETFVLNVFGNLRNYDQYNAISEALKDEEISNPDVAYYYNQDVSDSIRKNDQLLLNPALYFVLHAVSGMWIWNKKGTLRPNSKTGNWFMKAEDLAITEAQPDIDGIEGPNWEQYCAELRIDQ
jgi:soluble lytic murein transglycosylase-like protein